MKNKSRSFEAKTESHAKYMQFLLWLSGHKAIIHKQYIWSTATTQILMHLQQKAAREILS